MFLDLLTEQAKSEILLNLECHFAGSFQGIWEGLAKGRLTYKKLNGKNRAA